MEKGRFGHLVIIDVVAADPLSGHKLEIWLGFGAQRAGCKGFKTLNDFIFVTSCLLASFSLFNRA